MDRAIGNAARFTGLPIDRAAAMASSIPAAFMGMHAVGKVVADWNPATYDLHVISA
jgi:hypothetical protein